MAKVNTTDSTSKGISQKEIDEIAKKTGKYLEGQEKVMVRIPTIQGEQEDTYVECCINGYNYIIKRGESVSIPASIAELLRNAGII